VEMEVMENILYFVFFIKLKYFNILHQY